MVAVAEQFDTLRAEFDALTRDPRFGDAELGSGRRTAMQRFVARGYPTTRDEEWRFTNVAPIAETPFVRAPEVPVTLAQLEPYLVPGAMRIVLVNGRLVPALSTIDTLPPGLTAQTLREAGAGSEVGATTGGPFADLNAAFFEDGLAIAVPAKAIVSAPLHVLSVTVAGDRPAMTSPRLHVTVGERAEVSIVEDYVSLGAGAATFTNGVLVLRADASSMVRHVKLQRQREDAFHLATSTMHLARGATVSSTALTLGGRIARNDIIATLDGEGAECTLNGLYVATGTSLVDTHTTIHHAKPHCPSHEVYKGILGGRARAVFNGKIVVAIDAQKTDAKQTNKALLLSDDAQINTKPQLEIFADDVKCTHGAAIGQLDDDAMFYLRARGLSESDARNLLIHAFAGEVLEGVAVDAVREQAMRRIEATLGVTQISGGPGL
jgi:Fe-S cluster assembly protein SufD